jgi:DNA sulfur modification protein DndC
MISKEQIEATILEIQGQYLMDSTPWVIGYSGGKDSTAVVQLIFQALARLPKDSLHKAVHVLSNDTLVENPSVVNYLDTQMGLIEKAGQKRLFSENPDNFQVVKVVPKIVDRFWLNMIGKGYPPPSRWFRWCTDRMKINPCNEYIMEQVSTHGKAIIVLGTRNTESVNRGKSMQKHSLESIEGQKLRKHTLPNAWMYAPIRNWKTDEVWQYLMSVPNPWGGDNKTLVTLYRNASDATECPLVIDTTTPSCGKSRFGCWVCTVVDKDKSMENLIDNGEDWMIPLLDFRDYLTEVRYDETMREKKSSTYQDQLGPFKFHVRAKLLEELLRVEVVTDQEWIAKEELAAIQMQWNYDGSFDHSVAEIYQRIKNKPIMLPDTQLNDKEREELELLREVCAEHDVNPDHIRALLFLEKENASFLRRKNIFADMRERVKKFVNVNAETTESSNENL